MKDNDRSEFKNIAIRSDAQESQDPVPSLGIDSSCWEAFEEAWIDFTEDLCGASSTFSVKTLPRHHLEFIDDTFNGLLVRNQMAFPKLELLPVLSWLWCFCFGYCCLGLGVTVRP